MQKERRIHIALPALVNSSLTSIRSCTRVPASNYLSLLSSILVRFATALAQVRCDCFSVFFLSFFIASLAHLQRTFPRHRLTPISRRQLATAIESFCPLHVASFAHIKCDRLNENIRRDIGSDVP